LQKKRRQELGEVRGVGRYLSKIYIINPFFGVLQIKSKLTTLFEKKKRRKVSPPMTRHTTNKEFQHTTTIITSTTR